MSGTEALLGTKIVSEDHYIEIDKIKQTRGINDGPVIILIRTKYIMKGGQPR